MRKLTAYLLAVLTLLLTACGSSGGSTPEAAEDPAAVAGEPGPAEEPLTDEPDLPALSVLNYADQWTYISVGEAGACYALQNVPYCTEPADPSVQFIDIYVPVEYVDAVDNGNGTFTVSVREDGAITNSNGVTYTAATAPVIFQNSVDGYKQSDPIDITGPRKAGNGVGDYYDFIASGYVLVSLACRGSNSSVDGTAPAVILDMKAAVRLLKANDADLPGDMNRIIATGGSAGGGMASLLGASGNSDLYLAGLEEMGAVMDSTDDIYGVAAYCPITNLDTADSAFEWLHASETSLAPISHDNSASGESNNGVTPITPTVTFDEFNLALQENLYNRFLADLDAMGIDADAYYDGFLAEINECIANYIDTYVDDVEAFAAEYPYLNYDGTSVTAPDVETFVSNSMPRAKSVPSFDVTYTGSNENKLFGNQHFSPEVMAALEELSGEYEKAASALPKYQEQLTDERLAVLRMMTPNTFLTGEEQSTIAPHWRFRIGTTDGDLGASTAWLMTNLLQSIPGVEDVDYGLTWGKPHGTADYTFENIQQYVDSICA